MEKQATIWREIGIEPCQQFGKLESTDKSTT